MTCIVGVKKGDECWMGADSAAAQDWEVRAVKKPKLFEVGQFIIGYTTSFRMGQILQYHLDVPTQLASRPDDSEYMVQWFIGAVRKCLKEHGYAKIENNEESGGTFLVAYGGDIYEICSDFQVNQCADGLYAVGCGAPYALGAMKSWEHLPARDQCETGLRAADYFSGGVIEPYVLRDCNLATDHEEPCTRIFTTDEEMHYTKMLNPDNVVVRVE